MTDTKVKVCLLRILWPAGGMHAMWVLGIFGQNWKFINYTTIKQINYLLSKKSLVLSEVKHMSECSHKASQKAETRLGIID